jgi:glycosyltransferase involved in cell wall biosynthesis
MSEIPLVSLLIPTFNSALTVRDAIRSCREQTFRNIEIIVYDEVSKDGTREIIAEEAQRDTRIRVFSSDTNSGPVRAWRKLLYEARGKYFTWVWADDLILPDYVEKLVPVLEENPTRLITGCNAFTELLPETVRKSGTGLVTGVQSRKHLHEFPSVKVRGDEFALGVLAAVFPVSQVCFLYRTDAARQAFDRYINFENPYGFDFSRRAYGNEISLNSELALRSGEIILSGEPLAVCRASPDSMTVNARRTHRWQYWLAYVWAIRCAWRHCRDLSPRMDALLRVIDDRVSLCDFFYSLSTKHFPREAGPIKMIRALIFLWRVDRRFNKDAGPSSIQDWLSRQ